MKIGVTTTVPMEVIFAAGMTLVDLNNVFVAHNDPNSLVKSAEYAGFPRNCCSWIKGMYTLAYDQCDALLAVVEGDCSHTKAMVEVLKYNQKEIIPFAFPHDKDPEIVKYELDKLIKRLGTTWDETIKWKQKLDKIRKKVHSLDELTWRDGAFNSLDNHYYQISCSDFCGDPDAFSLEVDKKLAEAKPRSEKRLRLGYIGVPPIYTDFYQYMDSLGVEVCYNEIQRQFTMPFDTDNIIEQYTLYTYPYDVFSRGEDIKKQIELRNLDGIIHYTQSFCFRQCQDIVLRKYIDVPVLTIEGDAPSALDSRTKIRLESFVEMLGFNL